MAVVLSATKAIGYVRRSKESGERTVSLEAQRARIEEYAAAHGWALAEVLVDDGVSGGRRERLVRLEGVVRHHRAQAVVCYHLDRYARDVAALLDSLRDYERRGVELHVVGRGRIEVQTASGYLGVAIEGVMAEHFRKVISEKTRDALTRLRAKGRRFSGLAPYGFRFGPDGRLTADAGEQSALGEIARLSGAGLSLRGISRALAEAGILARCGRPFSAKVLRDLVTERAVGNSVAV